ncbi:hypothetical protein NCF85_01895 [Qipengyuania citrea]|uniref:Uncharacterized protein n=2 Tax=Qipengyuania TaxID=1855416 RepID=A0ABY4U8R6_9SPHN|nr:hypothetical protein [Qipengyuania citrea]MBL4896953.1 hypothetical protein [Erythrobacter sp.]USA61759.1 hypothetical protein NCF85_01895 [Qipengyuania citrea]
MNLHHGVGRAPIGVGIIADHAQGAPGDRQFLQLFDGGQAFDQNLVSRIAACRVADELGFRAAYMDAL